MAIDISKNIDRFQAGDTRQFTQVATETAPATVGFVLYDTNGDSLAPAAVQSGQQVANSGGVNLGLFYVNRVLPDTLGYYTYEWTAWDTNSLPYITRGEFEIIKTIPQSFFSYGEVADVLRTGRQLFGRADITQREIQDYMQPADDMINGKLGVIMSVPVSPTPPILRDMVKVFALYGFYSDRYSTEQKDAPPPIIRRRDDYMDLLTEIQSGNAVLQTQSGSIRRATPELASTTETYKPIFDSRDWPQQRVDPDLVDADADSDT